jgi:hypothetical protein
MFQGIATTTAIGTASYLWMTASAGPVSQALRATLRSRRGSGWRYALPVAIGVAALAAVMVSAMTMLIVMSAPHAGELIADRGLLTTGALSGLAIWSLRAAALGAPRLSPDVEIALALAVVALKTDDAVLLSMVEREYARCVVNDPADAFAPHTAHSVLGV